LIERGGIRFGIFGVLGKEAQFYTTGAGAVTFSDANETAREVATTLRDREKVDVVICLSHGGVEKGRMGASPGAMMCAWPKPRRLSTS
jgi:5'-nucleotidase / UDP-sugar diphosphatase